MAFAAAIVGAGAAVVGTVNANNAQKKAEGVQQQQIAEQKVQQGLQTQMQRRQSIRQAQLQRAQVQSFGQAAGAGGGSGIAGGLSSFGSQFGAAAGFSTQMGNINENLSGLSSQYAKFQGQAQRGQNIAQLGGALYGAAGGMEAIKTGFSSTTPTP
jgi:hypothetical protein